MVKTYTHNDLTWVDLNDPTAEEVREVMEAYGFHLDVADDLVSPTQKPQVNVFDDFIYVVFHIPAFKHSHVRSSNQEIDFLISEDTLITAHYDLIDPVHKFSKEFEVESIIGKNNIGEHAIYIFYYLVKKLYKSVEHELEFIESQLKEIEENIFQGKEREMVRSISKTSRVLLDFERNLSAQTKILESLDEAGSSIFGEDSALPLDRIVDIHHRVQSSVMHHRDMVRELRETNNSMVSTKQNEVIKILTIMAFVTFPLALLASIFSMNTNEMPIVGHPYDFWIIVSIMAIMVTLFFTFFIYKRWL